MIVSDIVYKIRRKSDGLYSMGGSTPSFNKTGKIWKKKGHLTSHLSQLDTRRHYRVGGQAGHVYADCEILPLKLTETVVGDILTIDQYLQNRKDRLAEEERVYKERRELAEKEKRRQEYEKLKQEFE